MKTSDAQPARSEITPIQTKTLTVSPAVGPAATDSLEMSASFITRCQPSERSAYVEEDSTDIYTLERCSPLNDF